jgi:hypothetical protein
MLNDRDFWGEVLQCETPDWQPLYGIVGFELADWFMWMFEIELDDGARVHAYKHIATRRYFHLAKDGRAFVYLPRGDYREIDRLRIIDAVFEKWEDLLPEPEDPEAVRAALARARAAAAAGTILPAREVQLE